MIDRKLIESRIYETTRTYDAVKCLCLEAKEIGFASVQVFPCMVPLCSKILNGSKVGINVLISYPHGGLSITQKVSEAAEAVQIGANTVEVVINTREIKSHNYDYILQEMKAVRNALPSEVAIKFNIEIECLTDEEVIETCRRAVEAKIDCIATSTGLYHTLDSNKNDVPLVTSVKEVELLASALAGSVLIQAEGCISTPEIAQRLIEAGASMISTEYASAVAE